MKMGEFNTVYGIKLSELQKFFSSIKERYGYDFSGYSKGSVSRRINRFMEITHIPTLHELQEKVMQDETFFRQFLQNLTVVVTEMFRDPLFFKALRTQVLPAIASYPVINIWIAGCATGEEVYSTAILLKEEDLLARTHIYATDINSSVLDKAAEGIFPLRNMKEYTNNYLAAGGRKEFADYYTARYNYAIFDKELSGRVIFHTHNLVSDQSFNEFHLIMCRNVLIYFEPELQNRVIGLFTDSLALNGFLSLGNKESLIFSESRTRYEAVNRSEKIFRRIK